MLVEAILVEISDDQGGRARRELGGRQHRLDDSTVPIGTFNQPVGGASIGSIAAAIADPDSIAPGAAADRPDARRRPLPRHGHRTSRVLLRALRSDGNTNILQTPSIITLDNEEAEIKVAQEVPFLTGSFTQHRRANQQGQVNPFQTIQREEVGTILKITPQINEGDAVQLKIEQEDSSVAAGRAGRGRPGHQQAHRSPPRCWSRTAASSCSAA